MPLRFQRDSTRLRTRPASLLLASRIERVAPNGFRVNINTVADLLQLVPLLLSSSLDLVFHLSRKPAFLRLLQVLVDDAKVAVLELFVGSEAGVQSLRELAERERGTALLGGGERESEICRACNANRFRQSLPSFGGGKRNVRKKTSSLPFDMSLLKNPPV